MVPQHAAARNVVHRCRMATGDTACGEGAKNCLFFVLNRTDDDLLDGRGVNVGRGV